MQQHDFDQFNALMQGVAENYGQTLTAEGIVLRFKMLAAFPLAEIQKAAAGILYSRKYTSMPTIADFIEHFGGGSVEDQAEVEAGKVLQAVVRIGGYSSVVFDDPVTVAVIQNAYGGWSKLCSECGVEESEKWFRHNFAKSWAAYKRRGIEAYGPLPGRHEIANTTSGFLSFATEPVLIGNQEKARQVLLIGASQGTRMEKLPISAKILTPSEATAYGEDEAEYVQKIRSENKMASYTENRL